jgi:hypothetical protein
MFRYIPYPYNLPPMNTEDRPFFFRVLLIETILLALMIVIGR